MGLVIGNTFTLATFPWTFFGRWVLATKDTESTKDADLTTVWAQVADCIKTGSWNAVYANSDEEFNKIVDDMISKANEYGYEKCVEFQQKEAERRKALEDEAKKAN